MTNEEIITVLLGLHGIDRDRISGIRTEDLIHLLGHEDERVAGNALYVGMAHPEVDSSRIIQAALELDRHILNLTLAKHAGDLPKPQARERLRKLLKGGNASVIKAATRTIVAMKMSDLKPDVEEAAGGLERGFQEPIRRMLLSLN